MSTKNIALLAITYFSLANLLSAKDIEVAWIDNTSGTINYPADKYIPEPYKTYFSNVRFNFAGNENNKAQEVLINKDLDKGILKEFVKAQNLAALREVFLKLDTAFLIDKKHLVAGQDYREQNGNFNVTSKYDPILILNVPVVDSKKSYRVSLLNDLMIATDWDTGVKRVKTVSLSTIPPTTEEIQKLVPTIFSDSDVKMYEVYEEKP